MSKVVLKVENLSKQYRLGQLGTGTMAHDVNRWWHKVRGKEDPYLKIGDSNDRSVAGGSEYVWSLKDINFEVQQGEVLGIIGKNGAGKSTLLKILSQVTTPTTGDFKAKGRIASLLEVGTGFHPDLSGRENVFLNGAILGMSKVEIKSKLDEIVEFSGVAKYLDTPVKRYSSGMMVRLGFAVAAHLEPEILIVDEVLAVGDAEFQKKCLGKMKDVAGQGRTVLFVSHHMASVRSLCTRGLLLNKGMIDYIGSTTDCVSRYLGSQDNYLTELNERTDRLGSGQLKFTSIDAFNNLGESKNEFFAGESINIKLKFHLNEIFNPKEFLLSLVFFDTSENVMAGFPTDEMGKIFDFDFEAKKGEIVLEVPELLFRPGTYFISIYSFLGGTGEGNYVDMISNAKKITVLNNDFFKEGILIRSGEYTLLKGKYK